MASPILRSIDPHEVATFLKERERYESEIMARQAECPSLTAVSRKSSVDRTLLKNLLYLGEIESVAPTTTFEKLTEEQVETFIRSLVTKPSDGYDPERIKRAIEGVKMSDDIEDPRAQVIHFASQFFEKMEGIG